MQYELFDDIESIQEIDGEKQVCKICKKEKHVSLFPKHRQFKTRLDNRCKACIKKQSQLRSDLRSKYQILMDDVCDCCGNTSNKSLVLDHDHTTNAFRGWICEPCNHGIGKLGDNIEGVEKALNYLRRHNDSIRH